MKNLEKLPLWMRRLEFCELIGISATTFHEWDCAGHLKVSRPSKRHTLVHIPTALAFLDSKSNRNSPDSNLHKDEGGDDA